MPYNEDNRNIIFVVDDDEAVCDSLRFFLEVEGFCVRVCADGDELLQHPDLAEARCVILDYLIPPTDGFEVLARLALWRIDLPVILITTNATLFLRERAMRAGVLQVVEKPLYDGTLLASIQAVLSNGINGK